MKPPVEEPFRIESRDWQCVCVCVCVCLPFFLWLRNTPCLRRGSGYECSSCVHTHSAVPHTIVLGHPALQGLKPHQIFHCSSFQELPCTFRLWGQFMLNRQSAGHYKPLVSNLEPCSDIFHTKYFLNHVKCVLKTRTVCRHSVIVQLKWVEMWALS